MTASSNAPGSDPQRLLSSSLLSDSEPRPAVWRSEGETLGASLALSWSEPTVVNAIRIASAGDPGDAAKSFLLMFDDGSSLLVTPDEEGDVSLVFPERSTSRLSITVAGAEDDTTEIALSALRVEEDDDTFTRSSVSARPVLNVSSTSAGGPNELKDGDPARGTPGGGWLARVDDLSPWVRATWGRPVEIASVQVLGPPGEPGGAAGSRPLHGVLTFSDGSSVPVGTIERGQDQPTTVAFAPRMVESVQLNLTVPDSDSEAGAGLREFAVNGSGQTPERWLDDGGYSAVLDRSTCGQSPAPSTAGAVEVDSWPVLLCPTTGAVVSGETTIVVRAAPGARLEAWGPRSGEVDTSELQLVGSATSSTSGRAVITLDTTELRGGPITVEVREVSGDDRPPLPVQLLNRSVIPVPSASRAPAGLTLQWREDFDEPVSVSEEGDQAVYASGKPSNGDMQTFGDATFADPDRGTVASVDGFLRLRVRPEDESSPYTPAGSSFGGMLSSARRGGGGFAAQYGYFEIRMTGAPGTGTWPAFWTLNAQSAVEDGPGVGEADVVELYGHDPRGSCHSSHNYDPSLPEDERGEGRCLANAQQTRWTTHWHIYAMRVTPDGATYYVDGTQVAHVDGLGRSDQPFFFLVDLTLGGGWPVNLSATNGRSDLYVDWIHVYT